jgi:hypothetical protein
VTCTIEFSERYALPGGRFVVRPVAGVQFLAQTGGTATLVAACSPGGAGLSPAAIAEFYRHVVRSAAQMVLLHAASAPHVGDLSLTWLNAQVAASPLSVNWSMTYELDEDNGVRLQLRPIASVAPGAVAAERVTAMMQSIAYCLGQLGLTHVRDA